SPSRRTIAPTAPGTPAARSISARMRNLSCAVNVRRRGRSKNSGDAAAGAGTIVGLRPSSLSAPAAARVLLSLILGITTGCLSYAPRVNSRQVFVSSSLARRVFVYAASVHIQSTKAAPRLFDADDIAAVIECELKSFAYISALIFDQRDNTASFASVRSVSGPQMKFNFVVFQFDNLQSGAFPT